MQVSQGAQVSSIDVVVNQGVVAGPFLTANLFWLGSTTLATASLVTIGSDGSALWAPEAAFGTAANRIGVTDSAWRAAASYCGGSATTLYPDDPNGDQLASFRSATLASVCPAAEAVAAIESSGAAKAVRFEGCAGQSTAVVLLRLDARAFALVRRFAAPVITDAGLLVGTASPANGGVAFVDVANRGAAGVVSVALSVCCGPGGACNGFTADEAVSHALDTAETVRFKLAFLVVGGRGDGAYCIAELWQAGAKEGSVRIELSGQPADAPHAPDDPIWSGPISYPGPIVLPNSTCTVYSALCGCGALQANGECIVVGGNVPNATLLCGEHGRAVPGEFRCECDKGWGTVKDQPALNYQWCTQVQTPLSNEGYKNYNNAKARLFILVPVALALCCCCCCGYICVSIGCKIRRCCSRRKRRSARREAKRKAKRERRDAETKTEEGIVVKETVIKM